MCTHTHECPNMEAHCEWRPSTHRALVRVAHTHTPSPVSSSPPPSSRFAWPSAWIATLTRWRSSRKHGRCVRGHNRIRGWAVRACNERLSQEGTPRQMQPRSNVFKNVSERRYAERDLNLLLSFFLLGPTTKKSTMSLLRCCSMAALCLFLCLFSVSFSVSFRFIPVPSFNLQCWCVCHIYSHIDSDI